MTKKKAIFYWGGATLKGALLAAKKMPSWTGLVHSSKGICMLVNDNQFSLPIRSLFMKNI